ncbi:MAG TPA: tetratricopeptide repeat protein, partial [Pilimelia sp.]|nr:tetratricopeptide repeat protein [Pilimelia sp.]
GKTALAVHWAYQIRDRFPDGQLYANLRGYAPAPPMRPIDVLTGFLRAMGVTADRIPADEQQATALYRSVLAGRRLLVVLDNARSAGQIRPLLPGAPGCLVLVTSRDRLGGLVARDGAHRVNLDVLTPEESVALLARLVGSERVDAEPGAAAGLAKACGYLPLALRIAAAALTDEPPRSITGYLAVLAAGDRLDALAVAGDEDAAVRATFDLSYATLVAPAQRLFRLLSLVPGPDFTVEAAAALTGTAVAPARSQLDRLVAAHLVGQHSPGRYAFHDLLRAYAAERTRAEDADDDRRAATTGLYNWYLHTAAAAARLVYPTRLRLTLPTAAAQQPSFDVPAEALAWLDAERANLVAAIAHAAGDGPRPTAWLLTDALRSYFWLRMHVADWLVVSRAGLAAAEADGDLHGQAAARLSLADAHTFQSEQSQAVVHYERALAQAEAAAWPEGQSDALGNLGIVHLLWGRLSDAADRFGASLAVNRQLGRLANQAANLGNLGLVYQAMGQLERAEDHFTRALALNRTTRCHTGVAVDLTNLGEVCHAMGRLDRALDYLDEALTRHREAGNRGSEADTMRAMAQVRHDAGQYAQAYETANAALALVRHSGERHNEPDALNAVAAAEQALGRHTAAIEAHRQALDLARETQTRRPEIAALVGLATAHLAAGQLDQARDRAREAQDLARQAGYRLLEAQAGLAVAQIHRARNEPDEALRHARHALALNRDTGHRLGLARTHLVLGHVLHDTGATDDGEDHWRQALHLFADAGVPEADEVRALLGS